jgi:hypothetical protein
MASPECAPAKELSTMSTINALIPDLSPELGIECYITNFIPIRHVLAVSKFLWPDFFIVENIVILEESRNSYINFQSKVHADPAGVESALNHRHLMDIFELPPHHPTPTYAQILAIGRLLKEMWTAKLRQDFPTRTFTVDFPENFNLEIDNPSISFWQTRPPQ